MERLTLGRIGVESLEITSDNLEYVNQIIPDVMSQLETDRANVELTDHPRMITIMDESKTLLSSLQEWKANAERQLRNSQMKLPRAEDNMSDEDEDDYDEDEDDGQVMEDVLGERLDILPAIPGTYSTQVENKVTLVQGIYDESNQKYYLFQNKLADTLCGCVNLAVRGSRRLREDIRVDDGGFFAIKVYDLKCIRLKVNQQGHKIQEDPIQELKIQQRLSRSTQNEPKILQIFGIYQDETSLYAVFPLAGDELFQIASSHNIRVNDSDGKILFRNMLEAINFCHQNGIAHRDVSPENFLIAKRGGDWRDIRLIDFGLACEIPRGEDGSLKNLNYTNFLGKSLYAAPEMWGYLGKQRVFEYDGRAIDYWSAVVTLFVVMFKTPLFSKAMSNIREFYIIVELGKLDRYMMHINAVSRCSPLLFDLLSKTLKLNPSERLSIDEALQHEWLTE